jgi:uncharacterized surface protein with fasciclin (FAS1) repeats
VFLPVDQAWKTLGLTEKYLLSTVAGDSLKKVLLHSILQGIHYSRDFPSKSKTFTTLAGGKVTLFQDGDDVVIDGEKIKMDEKDILAANGVAHSLSSVLIPSTVLITPENLINATGSTSWYNLLLANNLTQFLELNTNYSLLIPTDEAINFSPYNSKTITSLINFHIIPPVNGRPVDFLSNKGHVQTLSGRSLSLHKIYDDIYSIQFPNSTTSARILDQGKTSNGAQVLLIDRLLVEPVGGGGKSRWATALAVLIFAVAMTVVIASVVGYFVKRWQRRSETKPLFLSENTEEAEPFLNGNLERG